MLHENRTVPITYVVFNLLAAEGLLTTALPYVERRALLEALELERPGVQLVATFEDGSALFDAIVQLGFEGVVAKRERDPYRPGERPWVMTKNRAVARPYPSLASSLGRCKGGQTVRVC
jgi:bifunctional non-homologous end joining protein LigD